MEPIRLGISSCLLGQPVRWDGGHKRDAFLTETFGRWVQWVPVCPEAEVGMGTPREPVQLSVIDGATRMRGVQSGEDWTARMRSLSRKRLPELTDVCGYVFKKDSPSCGVFGAPRGLFAAAFRETFPLAPVEEEGRLSDPALRATFVSQVFAFARLRKLSFRPADLEVFHLDHECQLLAHSPEGHDELGRIVTQARHTPRAELRRTYGEAFMKAFAVPATPEKEGRVLEQVLERLEKNLSAEDRAEAARVIDEHRQERVPLLVPLTLLSHWVQRVGEPWLRRQTYFSPDPRELMLLNHV